MGLVIKTCGQLITEILPSSLSPASALVLSSDSTGYSSETEDSGKLRPFLATFPATIKLQAVSLLKYIQQLSERAIAGELHVQIIVNYVGKSKKTHTSGWSRNKTLKKSGSCRLGGVEVYTAECYELY